MSQEDVLRMTIRLTVYFRRNSRKARTYHGMSVHWCGLCKRKDLLDERGMNRLRCGVCTYINLCFRGHKSHGHELHQRGYISFPLHIAILHLSTKQGHENSGGRQLSVSTIPNNMWDVQLQKPIRSVSLASEFIQQLTTMTPVILKETVRLK